MIEPDLRGADPHLLAKARRHRARRVMQVVIVFCLLAATGMGADQLYTGGMQLFLQRPAGVGATPPTPAAGSTPTPARLSAAGASTPVRPAPRS